MPEYLKGITYQGTDYDFMDELYRAKFDAMGKTDFPYEAYGDNVTGSRAGLTAVKNGPVYLLSGTKTGGTVHFGLGVANMASNTAAYISETLVLRAGRRYLARVRYIAGSVAAPAGAEASIRFRVGTVPKSKASPAAADITLLAFEQHSIAAGTVLQAANMVDDCMAIEPEEDIRCGFVLTMTAQPTVTDFVFRVDLEDVTDVLNTACMANEDDAWGD